MNMGVDVKIAIVVLTVLAVIVAISTYFQVKMDYIDRKVVKKKLKRAQIRELARIVFEVNGMYIDPKSLFIITETIFGLEEKGESFSLRDIAKISIESDKYSKEEEE